MPGIALFLLTALPWYVAVQLKNPEFFRVFILEHNLARFGKISIITSAFLVLPARRAARSCALDDVRQRGLWWRVFAPGGRKRENVSRRRMPCPFSRDLADRPACLLFFFRIQVARLHFARPPGGHAVAGGVCSPPCDGRTTPWPPSHRAAFDRCRLAGRGRADDAVHRVSSPSALGPRRRDLGRICAVLAIGIALTLQPPRWVSRVLRFVTLVPVVSGAWRPCCDSGSCLDATLSARPLAQEIDRVDNRSLPLGDSALFREKPNMVCTSIEIRKSRATRPGKFRPANIC